MRFYEAYVLHGVMRIGTFVDHHLLTNFVSSVRAIKVPCSPMSNDGDVWAPQVREANPS